MNAIYITFLFSNFIGHPVLSILFTFETAVMPVEGWSLGVTGTKTRAPGQLDSWRWRRSRASEAGIPDECRRLSADKVLYHHAVFFIFRCQVCVFSEVHA